MSASHSIGPWMTVLFPDGSFEIVAADNYRPLMGGDILHIAARNPHTARVEEMHANARLMTAAPDLLAALVMMDGLRMLNKCFGDSDGAEIAKDMAVAAIAKATGAQA